MQTEESKKNIKILLTNDDGIDSPGIYALSAALKKIGELVIIAPDKQQSAVSHALTVDVPLKARKYFKDDEFFGWAVSGTPSDCVKLALSEFLDEKPDMVVSGINHGKNTSVNVLYSGTVAAATEGMLAGIPSAAFSLDSWSPNADCTAAGDIAGEICRKLLQIEIPQGTLINVNIPYLPADEIKGIRLTDQSHSVWKDHYEKRTDPFGRDYYWFSGEFIVYDDSPKSDDGALQLGYISITPLQFKFTDSKFLKKLKSLEIF